MYATLRQYDEITPADFEALMSRKADVEALIREVPGLVQYDLVRTSSGLASFTVCTDRAGTEASNKQVAEWIKQNLPALQANAPKITGGEDVLHVSA